MDRNVYRPHPLLKRVIGKIKPGTALDIGAGNGRNSIFLAKNNFKVKAIDINPESVRELKELSLKQGLDVHSRRVDLIKFGFPRRKYDLILAIQSLIWIRKKDFISVIKKIKASLKRGGIVVISGFTTRDPSFANLKNSQRTAFGKNTFYSQSQRRFWQFFEENELKKYFRKGFRVIYYKEKLVKNKPHDGILEHHFHGIAEIIAKKTED